MKEVKLTLTISEANLVLKALMKMPFIEVYQVIGKINEQSNEQLTVKAPAAEAGKGIMLH
jgi:hypothetical protein